MIVRWPGQVDAGSVCDGLVTSTDFFPTFAEIAAVDTSHLQQDEISLLGAWFGTQCDGLSERTLVWEAKGRPQNKFAVKRGGWKLVKEKRLELYDLRADPAESRDLYESHRPVADELAQIYWDWRERAGRIEFSIDAVEG